MREYGAYSPLRHPIGLVNLRGREGLVNVFVGEEVYKRSGAELACRVTVETAHVSDASVGVRVVVPSGCEASDGGWGVGSCHYPHGKFESTVVIHQNEQVAESLRSRWREWTGNICEEEATGGALSVSFPPVG